MHLSTPAGPAPANIIFLFNRIKRMVANVCAIAHRQTYIRYYTRLFRHQICLHFENVSLILKWQKTIALNTSHKRLHHSNKNIDSNLMNFCDFFNFDNKLVIILFFTAVRFEMSNPQQEGQKKVQGYGHKRADRIWINWLFFTIFFFFFFCFVRISNENARNGPSQANDIHARSHVNTLPTIYWIAYLRKKRSIMVVCVTAVVAVLAGRRSSHIVNAAFAYENIF